MFDLDGTLTESRLPISKETADLVKELLKDKYVGVVSGCSIDQMKYQLGSVLSSDNLNNLCLFPSTATCLYVYDGGWVCKYREVLNGILAERIKQTLLKVCRNIKVEEPYGEVIDDRGGQIAIALMGINAPLDYKALYDPYYRKRLSVKPILEQELPECEITIGGTTTITVTRKGIDKTNCIYLVKKYFNINKDEILFIGDTIFENGNDYPMKKAGVDCIQVANPDETKRIIGRLLCGIN